MGRGVPMGVPQAYTIARIRCLRETGMKTAICEGRATVRMPPVRGPGNAGVLGSRPAARLLYHRRVGRPRGKGCP